jgi:hypothetical protein
MCNILQFQIETWFKFSLGKGYIEYDYTCISGGGGGRFSSMSELVFKMFKLLDGQQQEPRNCIVGSFYF